MLSRLFKRKREIFHYHDGTRKRSIDPLVAYRALLTHAEFNPARHIPELQEGNLESHHLAVRAVREVFGVPAWSEGSAGLTERETIALLFDFDDYLGELKKNTSPTPTSPPATESPDSPTSTTSATSDCGSTSPAARPDKPSESSAPSAQP